MENNVRKGKLFEMGLDGYGYLIDGAKPSQIYAFHTSMIKGALPEGRKVDLEDCIVSFTLVNDHPEQIEIVQFRPEARAHA